MNFVIGPRAEELNLQGWHSQIKGPEIPCDGLSLSWQLIKVQAFGVVSFLYPFAPLDGSLVTVIAGLVRMVLFTISHDSTPNFNFFFATGPMDTRPVHHVVLLSQSQVVVF